MLRYFANLKLGKAATNKRVAVASNEGIMVNLHLGEAPFFYIFEEDGGIYRLVEQRAAPDSGTGDSRWIRLGEIFSDCRAVLVAGVGARPVDILSRKFGLDVVEMTGLIEDGLDSVYKGKILRSLSRADMQRGGGCSGKGMGCCG